ncbi:integral membrane protein [Zea mays]|uniref:Glycerophosphocholine acyltransferase 1 n=1 Tax=Zea mays TaxID=4577 RepID=A0A1D6NRG7_MAIZE|nr:integral membrane protein [Zea mays]AQL00895.1 integral membrane protein [Zea mays]AQL00896.1 integral membrane protein [Zea mays]
MYILLPTPALFIVATMALTVPIFLSYRMHVVFLILKVCASTWNGGSFILEGDLALIDWIKEIPCEPRVEVVLIDDAFVERKWMECLFQPDAYLGDKVIDCYINLIKAQEHLKCRSGGRVHIENAFQFNFLKRDGDAETKTDELYPSVYSNKYRENALVSCCDQCKNMEIQVLDSLGTSSGRNDLIDTIKDSKDKLIWYLNLLVWPLSTKLYRVWTGDELSDNFTQDDMSHFRKKLAAILLSSDINKRKGVRYTSMTKKSMLVLL